MRRLLLRDPEARLTSAEILHSTRPLAAACKQLMRRYGEDEVSWID